jgi:phosphatidylserine decarboxylase
MGIPFYSRKSGKIEEEKVLGELMVKMAYHPTVLPFTDKILSKKLFSNLAGWVQDQGFSSTRIQNFIQDYGIDMNEFEKVHYKTFNEFFIRKFIDGVRPFPTDDSILPAFAEARYLAVENITAKQTFRVKDAAIDLVQLLGDSEMAKQFEGGTLMIARLCPVDYHRFHFPVESEIARFYKIEGAYHSVNPDALRAKPDLLLHNERHITALNSKVFGHYALVEVGAFGVGKIIQTHSMMDTAKKGEEKGYFLFGGSTVIGVFQAGRVKLSEDLKKYSAENLETWIPLGGTLGHV